MKKIILLILSVLLSLSLFACKADVSNTEQELDEKITVVVSVVPETTFVEKVAGDLVRIVTLIPSGNSPANYQPTAAQMQSLSDAKLYFTMHTPTEEANILPKVNDFNRDIKIVNLRDAVSDVYPLLTISGHGHEETSDQEGLAEHEEAVDPHIWLSPKRVIIMVQIIANKLSEIDIKNEQTYQENADKYIKELEELDREITQNVSSIKNKAFMIYHGSYGYFADDYALRMITLESAGKPATAAEMQEIIDFAKKENIKTVFYQEEFDGTQAKTIADEIGGSVAEAAPLSADYIQSLKDFVRALAEQGG